MSKRKILSLLAVFTSVSLLLGACGSDKKSDSKTDATTKAVSDNQEEADAPAADASDLNEVGTYPIVKSPVEMTMFRLSMPNVVDFAENDFTKFIEETTGVKWTFQTTALDTETESVNLAMAGKELPDVFMFTTPDVVKFGVAEGLLIPLEDLIKDNMPNFNKMLESKPELLAQITQTDGHIYGLPSINECYHCKYRNKMWVNEKALADIGAKVPTTTEEFKNVLKLYMEQRPDAVGISGSIDGWGQQFYDWIVNAFILDPGVADGKKVLNMKEQKIETIANKDEYREALKYMNELFNMGAIYDGTFTQNQEQYRSLMNQSGDPVLFAPYGTISDGFDVNSKPESYASYRVIAPIEGPNKVRNATYFKYDGVAENKFVITTECEHPEIALRWADYFYSLEGYLSMQYGADNGTDWVLNPEGKKGLNGEPALYEVLNNYSSQAQNHDWQDTGLNFATNEIRLGSATEQGVDLSGPDGLEELLYAETAEKCEPYGQNDQSAYQVAPVLKLTADEVNELQVIVKELNDYIDMNRTAFIRGTQDVNDDAQWKAYIDGFEGIGLPRFLEVQQLAYDRQFKQ